MKRTPEVRTMQGRKQRIPAGPTRHVVGVDHPVRSAQLVEAVVPEPAEPTPNHTANEALAEQTLQTLQTIESTIAETELRRQQSLEELRLVAIEMSVAIAARVIRGAVETETFGIEEIVTEAVERFGGTDQITVSLNPADLSRLESALDGRPPPWPKDQTPRLTANQNVAPGGCEVHGADFHYVSRMELVLDEIRAGLLESLEHAQIERRRTQAASSGLRRFPDRRETA